MARLLGVVLAAAVVLAGCSVPVADPDAGGPATPDPRSDRLGWEAGYWHNETLDIDSSDGVNRTERHAIVARAMARVEHLRRLEFEKPVPVEVVSRETYRREFADGNRSYSQSFRRFDNAKFEALFLIGEDEDALGTQDRNRGANVLGQYSPRNESIIVVSETGRALPGETTLAHELVHALQDQHYDLNSFERPTRERFNAINGLIEGDATFIDRTYGDRCGTAWECYQQPDGGERRAANASEIHFGVYFLNFFPYSDGPSFVRHWRDRGGWARVNDLYGAPPASSEQVIRPPRYGVDEPTTVSLADRTRAGWKRVRLGDDAPDRPDYAVLGQSALAAMFAYTIVDGFNPAVVVDREEFVNTNEDGQLDRFDPFNYDLAYTRGWDGDRLHVYERGDETAYVWRLEWDSPAEADEFAAGYRSLLAHWGGERIEPGVWRIVDGPFQDAFAVRVDGARVTIVNAPDVADLEDIRRPR